MSYFIYNVLLTLLFLAVLPFVPVLSVMGERFRAGLWQRLGWYSKVVKNQFTGDRPVWIHAASVGEVFCAAKLTQELSQRFPGQKIVVSTFTSSGNKMARQATTADGVLFLPLDFSWIVRRALKTFDPSALIVLETEIWPNLLREAGKRGIPTVLLSGRISPGAFKKYAWFIWFFRKVLPNLTAMGMQTEQDAERIVKLGTPRNRVLVTGSLKRAIAKGVEAPRERARGPVGKKTRAHPLLVVGSSHRGEEEILLDVFVSLRTRFPDLQMVLAPRHPQRFSEVEQLLRNRGVNFAKKSQVNGRLYFEKDVLLLDTLGDLLNFYALGDVAFVGGTLVDAGGHNLLEPARFGKPVLFGPYTANVEAVAMEMKNAGGGIQVTRSEELIEEIANLLGSPEQCRRIGEKAYQIATDQRGVLDHSLALVYRYLADRGDRPVAPTDQNPSNYSCSL